MFPVFGYDPFPIRSQQPLKEHLPRPEFITPQIKVDPMSRPPYEPYGYADQVQGPAGSYPYHYPYYYGYRPPQPHLPPPPAYPHPMYGGWPMYPDPYAPYYAPPPYYSVQSRVENERTPQEHHCCGCHNHSCHATEDKTLKKGGPVKEPDKSDDQNDAQLPTWLKGFPYPVMWIPNGRIKGTDQERESDDVKPNQEPNVPGSPSDMKSIRPMMLGGKDELPFPVFWLPRGSLGIDGGKSQEANAHVKHNSSRIEEINAQEPAISADVGGHGNDSGRDKKAEQKSNAGDKVTKESAKHGVGKNPSSLTKSTKLSPVCLRVDPLPKKRQGASRSPSLPKQKHGQMDKNAVEQGEVDKKTANDGAAANAVKEQLSRPRDVKVVQVKEVKDGDDEVRVTHSKHENKAVKVITEQNERDKGERVAETVQENQQANKSVKMILSGAEAATVIQSAYRGYELRRCEPLKKLKQIAEIRKEAVEIKNRIDAIESCHGATVDAKEKVILGETIMKLLLKLDTIQGLHWSFRDMRKSVAKELVGLQEKLDGLVIQSSPFSPLDIPASQIAETLPTGSSHQDVPAGGETKVKLIKQHGDPGSQQPFPSHLPAVPDAVSGSVNEASEVVDPADIATPWAGGVSESVTSEVVPLMEQGASDETVKVRGDTLAEASKPSSVIGENQQVMEVALSEAHDDSYDFEKIEKGGNYVLTEALESSPVVVEIQQVMEASLSGAPELLKKTANEEAELTTELPRTDPEEEESAHEGTTGDLHEEELGCNEPHVVKDVPIEESAVKLMEQQSTVVLDSEVPIAQVGGDGDDQVNVAVQESPSGTDASAIHVEEENQMQEFRDEAETLMNSAAVQSEVVSTVDEEVEASGFSTSQVLDMSEATKEVIQRSPITSALADLEIKSITADSNSSKAIQMPDSTREEGFTSNKEDGIAPTTQEKEEHDITENADGEINEMIKGLDVGNDICLVESSTILDPQENVDLEHKKPHGLEEENLVDAEDDMSCNKKEISNLTEHKGSDVGEEVDGNDVGAAEESEMLKNVLEKLTKVGKKQKDLIINLQTKVRDLEKKLARRQKLKTKRTSKLRSRRATFGTQANVPSESPMGVVS
ncbi:BAG family molecular chaperone regulator 6-like protein [Drosera capensis]